MSESLTNWLLGLLSMALAAASAFIVRQFKTLRDHDERLNRHDDALDAFMEAVQEMKRERESCQSDRRTEEGKIHARIDAMETRMSDKLDEVKDSFTNLAIRVERATARCSQGDQPCRN